MSKSFWNFSGRHWAGWTATWAGLIAVVIAMPGAPDKSLSLAAAASQPREAHKYDAAASPVSVVMHRVDFGALPDTAFGDYDPSRDKH